MLTEQLQLLAGLCFGADCRASWAEAGSFWTGSSAGNIWNINTGNVGIGTSMPAKKLSVVGDSEFIGDISGTGFLRITNSAANNWISGKLGIGNATQGAANFMFLVMQPLAQVIAMITPQMMV